MSQRKLEQTPDDFNEPSFVSVLISQPVDVMVAQLQPFPYTLVALNDGDDRTWQEFRRQSPALYSQLLYKLALACFPDMVLLRAFELAAHDRVDYNNYVTDNMDAFTSAFTLIPWRFRDVEGSFTSPYTLRACRQSEKNARLVARCFNQIRPLQLPHAEYCFTSHFELLRHFLRFAAIVSHFDPRNSGPLPRYFLYRLYAKYSLVYVIAKYDRPSANVADVATILRYKRDGINIYRAAGWRTAYVETDGRVDARTINSNFSVEGIATNRNYTGDDLSLRLLLDEMTLFWDEAVRPATPKQPMTYPEALFEFEALQVSLREAIARCERSDPPYKVYLANRGEIFGDTHYNDFRLVADFREHLKLQAYPIDSYPMLYSETEPPRRIFQCRFCQAETHQCNVETGDFLCSEACLSHVELFSQ